MFGLTSKQRNATKMVCYSELTSSLTSAEIKPILILVYVDRQHSLQKVELTKEKKAPSAACVVYLFRLAKLCWFCVNHFSPKIPVSNSELFNSKFPT